MSYPVISEKESFAKNSLLICCHNSFFAEVESYKFSFVEAIVVYDFCGKTDLEDRH